MMRKHFLMLLLAGYLLPATAQHSLEKTHNMLRQGDVVVKQQVHYKSPGREGANVLWDFSKQELIEEQYKVSFYDYPDTLVIAREQRTMAKHYLKGDTLQYVGYETPTTILDYEYPMVELIFPVRYLDTYENYYQAHGNYCDQIDLDIRGKSSYEADAHGMILLPDGEMLDNVLRVHQRHLQTERRSPHYHFSVRDTIFSVDSIEYRLAHDSLWLQTDIYRWYVDGYRYPVFETFESTIYQNGKASEYGKTSFFYPPNEQYYGLEDDPENRERREELLVEKEKKNHQRKNPDDKGDNRLGEGSINYNLFTSEDGNRLSFEYHLQQETRLGLGIYDIQGRMWDQKPQELQTPGYGEWSVSTESYPKGEYILRIAINDQVIGEKFSFSGK